jgi:hypothetical protein
MERSPVTTGPLIAAATLIGIGMGGFVDGIVLHQILQWHHMLSVPMPPIDLLSVKVNMVWDGLFHAFTWIVTFIGLLLLWRVLATMMETAPDGDVFAELEELGGLLEAQVIEEEQTLFPKVSQEVDEADLRQLGARMSEMVEQLRRERAPRMHVAEETEEPASI